MANYLTTDTELTSVANAIRAKTGETGSLEYPADFITAIENIPGGSAVTVTEEPDTNGGTKKIITAVELTSDTVTAAHLESGYTAHDASGQAITGSLVPGGGGAPVVIGTFTGAEAEKGTEKTIDLGYTGSGYPISAQIYVADGTYNPNSSEHERIQKYGFILYNVSKTCITGEYAVPSYNGSDYRDKASILSRYKDSTSIATSYSNNSASSYTVYTTTSASSVSTNVLHFYDKTTLKVFIADTSYGFMDGIEYKYIVTYSS